MSSDASAAAASPMTNGAPQHEGHREADASTNYEPAATASSSLSSPLLEVCADLHGRVVKFLNAPPTDALIKRTQEQTRIAFEVIEKALEDYGFDALSLSYNGGKDCLVLLIIYLAVLHKYFTNPSKHQTPTTPIPQSLPSIYARPPDPFPSVTSFVESSTAEYHLDLIHICTDPTLHPNLSAAKSHTSPPPPSESIPPQTQLEPGVVHVPTFRDAFAHYLDTHSSVLAIFVGTRRTDPHGGHLTHFDMTDGNWPRFMRIHPVIDWHLDEIWCFLRSPCLADPNKGLGVLEYCGMYDEGYTSLGGVGDTLRNPRLRYVDGETGEERYRPAWALTDDSGERLGRE